MNTTMGEILLLSLIASVILVAAIREVFLFARWMRGMRKIRTDD